MDPDAPYTSKQIRGVETSTSRPLAYKEAVRAIVKGKTLREVQHQTGIGKDTLTRIRRDCAEMIEEKQLQNVAKMAVARERAVDMLIEKMDDVDPSKLAITIGILDDKLERAVNGRSVTHQAVTIKLPERLDVGSVIDLLPTATDCNESTDHAEDAVPIEERDALENRCEGAGGIEREVLAAGATD